MFPTFADHFFDVIWSSRELIFYQSPPNLHSAFSGSLSGMASQVSGSFHLDHGCIPEKSSPWKWRSWSFGNDPENGASTKHQVVVFLGGEILLFCHQGQSDMSRIWGFFTRKWSSPINQTRCDFALVINPNPHKSPWFITPGPTPRSSSNASLRRCSRALKRAPWSLRRFFRTTCG